MTVAYTGDMSTAPRQSRYSKEEFARLGEEIYERDIVPKLGPQDEGKVAVIEVETGDYELDKDDLSADDRLRERHPDSLFWFRRVGSRYYYRFGYHRSTAA